MVTRFGMSDGARPISLAEPEEVFLGHSVSRHAKRVGSDAQKIDSEVRRIIERPTAGKQILRSALTIARAGEGPAEYETPGRQEIKALLRGERPGAHALRRARSAPQSRPAATVPQAGRPREPGITIAPSLTGT